MHQHSSLTKSQLHGRIRKGFIRFAGNTKLRIYGLLNCASGKKMKTENRVFFTDESEAVKAGYRPCGHCMRQAYLDWKSGSL